MSEETTENTEVETLETPVVDSDRVVAQGNCR